MQNVNSAQFLSFYTADNHCYGYQTSNDVIKTGVWDYDITKQCFGTIKSEGLALSNGLYHLILLECYIYLGTKISDRVKNSLIGNYFSQNIVAR